MLSGLAAMELKVWVDYALINEALIIFDASYADFARSPGTVKSIYQIENAAECAVDVLAGDDVRQEPSVADDGRRSVVAGRFYAENDVCHL